MVQVRGLTELRLKDLWEEVKDEERWWGDLKEETLRAVKGVLETAMEIDPFMPRWSMSSQDLSDLVSYLQTLK